MLHLAALKVWFGREKELAATCQRALALAEGTNDPFTVERMARVRSFPPSQDKAELDATVALARRAVDLGKGNA